MSQFIHVFCQSDDPIRAGAISEYIEDGQYFDEPPVITPAPSAAQEDDTLWARLEIKYEPQKRPVFLSRKAPKEKFKDNVEEAIEELESAGLATKQGEVIARIKSAKQLFVFEIDPAKATDECWEMVSNLEGWIAHERDGVIYASGDGIYNGELELICQLPD